MEGTELEQVPMVFEFEPSGHDKRLYILLVAHTSTGLRFGRDHLFQERITSLDNAVRKLVGRAVEDLKIELKHGGCVDEYMADQVVVYRSLARGKSVVDVGEADVSLHAQTAHWVAEELLAVSFDDQGNCEGTGWVVGQRWERPRRSVHDADDVLHDLGKLNVGDEG